MKANELMIGDWLWYQGRFNAFPFKVEQIAKRKVGYHAFPGEYHMNYIRLCECKPIPLTTEILEKNGIEFNYNHGYFKEDENYELELFKNGDDIIYWSINSVEYLIIRIKYVHQLQNAIRLCGFEKEIIL